jgi:asparagine synthase (glutamine-hydrolysing)
LGQSPIKYMCGIFGFITPNQPVDMSKCAAGLGSLQHRGPDGFGIATGRLSARRLDFSSETKIGPDPLADVYLGHMRLAIVDLSETALQPMTNETRDVWVVFNGEIYNHAELRAQLIARGHRFATHHSDTEVLVHGFEEWGGRGLVDRLRGMFAFAALDLRTRQLFIARDPFGEKPMYVVNDERGVVFASELKAVLRTEFIAEELSQAGLADYLRFGYVPAPGAILERVWKLRASEMATFDLNRPGTCRKEQYWQLADYRPVDVAPERWLEEFDARISHSVQQRLMSDVPLGAFLSGGLDSATVVRHMSRHAARPRTFTIGFPGHPCDETPYAQAVSARYETEHRVGELNSTSLLDQVANAARIFDEPFADASALPMILLSDIARQSVTVTLSGDGGDELLAGYTRYHLNTAIDRWLGNMTSPLGRGVGRLASLWPHTARGFGIARLLRGDGRMRYEALLADEWLLGKSSINAVPGFDFSSVWDGSADHLINQMCNADIRLYVPEDLMVKVDRVSMAVGLEVRAPFLDRDLFEFVATAPQSLRKNGRVDKSVFRSGLAADLGTDFTTRRKQGFSVPLGTWFRGELRERVADTFSANGGFLSRFFPKQWLGSLLDDHVSGSRDQSHWIWLLLALENWHEAHAPHA